MGKKVERKPYYIGEVDGYHEARLPNRNPYPENSREWDDYNSGFTDGKKCDVS